MEGHIDQAGIKNVFRMNNRMKLLAVWVFPT